MTHTEINQRAWNHLAESGSRFAKTATDEECREPLKTLDQRGWLPASVSGLEVLCLAAGGGWQSILYAMAGARVTVVDISPSMLAQDQREAERRGLTVRGLEGSMDDLSELNESSFDIVHQPVSTCYVPKLRRVYGEVARVLRPGGLYISQHKQPTSLQIGGRDPRDRYFIQFGYYQKGPLPPSADLSYREHGTVEFLHRWEELVGDLCECGFVIEDLKEPFRGDPDALPGDFHHRGMYIAPYVRIKARRVARTTKPEPTLWVPE